MAPGSRTKAGSDGRAQLIKKADSDSVESATMNWWQNGEQFQFTPLMDVIVVVCFSLGSLISSGLYTSSKLHPCSQHVSHNCTDIIE